MISKLIIVKDKSIEAFGEVHMCIHPKHGWVLNGIPVQERAVSAHLAKSLQLYQHDRIISVIITAELLGCIFLEGAITPEQLASAQEFPLEGKVVIEGLQLGDHAYQIIVIARQKFTREYGQFSQFVITIAN